MASYEISDNGNNVTLNNNGLQFDNSTFSSSIAPTLPINSNTQFNLPQIDGTTDKVLRWTPSNNTEWVPLSSIVIGNNFINNIVNAGNAGEGFFDNITGNTASFRNLNIVGSELTLTLDAPIKILIYKLT